MWLSGKLDRTSGKAELILGELSRKSIVVDHEGNIYVADVHNQRIQKFAP